jgi:hypothetical protein
MAQQGKPNNLNWNPRTYMGEGKNVKPQLSSNLHTYIHTYVHTYMHTHACAHAHTLMLAQSH